MTKPYFLKEILVTVLLLLGTHLKCPLAQTASIFENELLYAEFKQDSITALQQEILLGLIDQSFLTLAEEGRQGRRIGGTVLLGLGVGSAAGGAATLIVGKGDVARIVGYSLIGGGALMSGLSLIPFKVRTEAEHVYSEFSKMPENTPQEMHQKFLYWDHRFEELARKWRRERIIGGVTSIVSTGITSFVIAKSSDATDPNAYIWPAVGGAIGGISSFLIESEKERQFKIYRSSKAEILNRSQQTEIRFGVAPGINGGLLTTINVQF